MASFIILSLRGILGLALICLPVIILLVSVLVLVRLVVRKPISLWQLEPAM